MRSGYDWGLSGPSYESRLALFMEGDQSFEHFLLFSQRPSSVIKSKLTAQNGLLESKSNRGFKWTRNWVVLIYDCIVLCQLESEISNIITDLIMVVPLNC